MKHIAYFWRNSILALLSLSFIMITAASVLYLLLYSQLPPVDSLKDIKLQVPLRIYTQDGRLIQEYGEKRRIPVAFKDIPKPLIHAVLATEDQRFFEHAGVDFFGLSRAAIRMIQTGTKSQGGSTITMQVARNFFLDRKKTFLRKFKEILLAIKIDNTFSKETILELYLNRIYLGNRAYGVGAAAQIYYGKTLQELTLGEMAMIAGLPQAPSTQNPIINPTAAKKRRDHVLERMLEDKFITKEDYQSALSEPINVEYHGAKIEVEAPYVAEMIRQSLYQHFGKSAYTKGYKVYTTIQAPLQLAANEAVNRQLAAYHKRHGSRSPIPQAALVALNTHSGEIEALVGGSHFASSKYNRAVESNRQPGSSFKPFIYAAALSKGYTLATLINDAPIVMYDPSQPNAMYRPRNHTNNFEGPIRLREALAKSTNMVPLRILDDIGMDYATTFIEQFGFPKSTLPKGLSLALGSLTVSPLDLTRAYATFANGGFFIQPYLIREVTDNEGKVLLHAKPTEACDHCQNPAQRILSEDQAFLMKSALKGVIDTGTGSAARVLKREDLAGKTGTTNEHVDAWFVGFHPDLAVTVWMGFDTPRSLHEYAASGALPLWIDFMKVALETLPVKPFNPPASVTAYPIDKKTGLLTRAEQPGSVMEYFQKDYPPESNGSETLAAEETGTYNAPATGTAATDLF